MFWLPLFLLAAAGRLDAQGARSTAPATLELVVVEESTLLPLRDVRVQLFGSNGVVLTDRNGRARLQGIPPGEHILSLTRLGYAPERILVEFTANAKVEAEIALAPQPIPLQGVEATVSGPRLSRTLHWTGFYDRKKSGLGTYLTRDDLERMRPIDTMHIFRQMRGFRVVITRMGEPNLVASRAMWEQCSPHLYIDGVRVHMGERLDPSEYVAPHHIEGIETYAGPASIPPQFNVTGSACGVVLIWTRRGP